AVVGRIDQPGALELPEERGEGAGRRGEVVEPVAPGRTGAVQLLELRSQAGKRSGLVEGAGHVAYPRREVLPDLGVDRLGARERSHRLAHVAGELVRRELALGIAHDSERLRLTSVDRQFV